MKTTVELPDTLYRRVKSRAAMNGQSVKAFLLEALRDKLVRDRSSANGESGWKAVFGAARADDVAEVQRIIDAEFSRVDPDDWK
jgi:plasmid stability protein